MRQSRVSAEGFARRLVVGAVLTVAAGGLGLGAPRALAVPVDSAGESDPHVRGEIVGVLTDMLVEIGSSGALQEMVGPAGTVTGCVIGVAGTGAADAAAVLPCFGTFAEVDPSVALRLASSIRMRDLVATLAAARTPHDPSTPHGAVQDRREEPDQRAVPTPSRTRPVPDDARPSPQPRVAGTFVAPTTGTITSTFGDGRNHRGIDIANSVGATIVAVADGTVISAGPAEGFGLWVRVRHDDGTVTTYGHNNTNAVRVGQQVRAGDRIATVGNRGNSTGPHLHFEVTDPTGNTVDPLKWLSARGVSIPEADDN